MPRSPRKEKSPFCFMVLVLALLLYVIASHHTSVFLVCPLFFLSPLAKQKSIGFTQSTMFSSAFIGRIFTSSFGLSCFSAGQKAGREAKNKLSWLRRESSQISTLFTQNSITILPEEIRFNILLIRIKQIQMFLIQEPFLI